MFSPWTISYLEGSLIKCQPHIDPVSGKKFCSILKTIENECGNESFVKWRGPTKVSTTGQIKLMVELESFAGP